MENIPDESDTAVDQKYTNYEVQILRIERDQLRDEVLRLTDEVHALRRDRQRFQETARDLWRAVGHMLGTGDID